MASLLDEHQSWQDEAGKPLVGASVYVGTAGNDPELNPASIYSDRELTVSLANPQTTNANGRTQNKVYVAGRYSIKVEDSSGSQVYQNLNAGEDEVAGVTSLSGEQGINSITAQTSSGITSYTDKQQYVFRAAADNTGSVTLNIDNVGAKTIKKAFDTNLESGDIQQDVTVIVSYNATDDVFDLVSPITSFKFLIKGADVASASALTLGDDGNYFDITGTTTITSIATKGVGTVVKLHFDAALTLTHNATDLILPGGENITTAAGDEAEFIEYATGDWRCTNYQYATGAGKVVQIVNVTDGALATGTTAMPNDDTIPQNTEGTEFMSLAITPKSASNFLKIDVVLNLSPASSAYLNSAIFQDSTVDALDAHTFYGFSGGYAQIHSYSYYMVAGTTSETTFKVRAGGGTAIQVTFNGITAARIFGGVLNSSITITEFQS